MITTSFPRWPGDFSGRWIHEMARHLAARGHVLQVLAPHQRGVLVSERLEDVDVQRFRYAPEFLETEYGGWYSHEQVGAWRQRLTFLLRRLFVPMLFISGVVALVRACRRDDIDVILAHWAFPAGLMGLIANRVVKARLVVYVYGGDVVVLPRSFVFRRLVPFVLRQADTVLCISRETKKDADLLGLPPGKAKVLYLGTDQSRFQPGLDGSRVRKALGIGEEHLLVMSVGRLVWYKGFDQLIAAARLATAVHPSLRFVIGGVGPLDGALRQQIEALSLSDRVTLVGLIPDAELQHYYAACDMYVSSSVVDAAGNREGLGVTIIEAMACARPIIVTDAGAPGEYVEDGENGLVVEQSNPEALASAIVALASDEELRQRLAHRGLATVQEEFQWPTLTLRLEEFLAER